MGIGEPVKMEMRSGPTRLVRKMDPKDVFPSEFRYWNMKRLLYLFIGMTLAISYTLFFPIVIGSFITDWRIGIPMLFFPMFMAAPVFIAVVPAFLIVYILFEDQKKYNYTYAGDDALFIYFKAGRNVQSIDVIIPYSNIKEIVTDADMIDREIKAKTRKPLKILFDSPLPPIEGLFNALAGKEDLSKIVLKEPMILRKFSGGGKNLTWSLTMEPRWVDHVIINISEKRKIDFRYRMKEKMVRVR
ncbi:MAG: hypothetical protein ACMUIG_03985 [Thermoplasmatota archaeon]